MKTGPEDKSEATKEQCAPTVIAQVVRRAPQPSTSWAQCVADAYNHNFRAAEAAARRRDCRQDEHR